jgi:hypothetical protein
MCNRKDAILQVPVVVDLLVGIMMSGFAVLYPSTDGL